MQLLLGLLSLYLVSGTEGERTGCPVFVFLRTESDQGLQGSREVRHYERTPAPGQKEAWAGGEGALTRPEQRICSLTY